jgi:hypothetical protein
MINLTDLSSIEGIAMENRFFLLSLTLLPLKEADEKIIGNIQFFLEYHYLL